MATGERWRTTTGGKNLGLDPNLKLPQLNNLMETRAITNIPSYNICHYAADKDERQFYKECWRHLSGPHILSDGYFYGTIPTTPVHLGFLQQGFNFPMLRYPIPSASTRVNVKENAISEPSRKSIYAAGTTKPVEVGRMTGGTEVQPHSWPGVSLAVGHFPIECRTRHAPEGNLLVLQQANTKIISKDQCVNSYSGLSARFTIMCKVRLLSSDCVIIIGIVLLLLSDSVVSNGVYATDDSVLIEGGVQYAASRLSSDTIMAITSGRNSDYKQFPIWNHFKTSAITHNICHYIEKDGRKVSEVCWRHPAGLNILSDGNVDGKILAMTPLLRSGFHHPMLLKYPFKSRSPQVKENAISASSRQSTCGAGPTKTSTVEEDRVVEGPLPSALQQATTEIVSNGQCATSYSGIVNIASSMLCATDPGIASCNGDSGGPIFVRSSPGAPWIQVGIASFGVQCANDRYPSVYTRVSSHLPWILKHMLF
uniref:Peptidase S1 domain-containing protein n=1 Tax=Daphnia galeata TaxID=27404 RepID=A0A8J2RN34_9CRUS|nr:unnamed protein product [Daphnia galeata]